MHVKSVESHLLGQTYWQSIKKYMQDAKPTKKETKAKKILLFQEPPVKRVKIMEQYECNICAASFETVKELKNHFSIHQDENKEEE